MWPMQPGFERRCLLKEFSPTGSSWAQGVVPVQYNCENDTGKAASSCSCHEGRHLICILCPWKVPNPCQWHPPLPKKLLGVMLPSKCRMNFQVMPWIYQTWRSSTCTIYILYVYGWKDGPLISDSWGTGCRWNLVLLWRATCAKNQGVIGLIAGDRERQEWLASSQIQTIERPPVFLPPRIAMKLL